MSAQELYAVYLGQQAVCYASNQEGHGDHWDTHYDTPHIDGDR